MKPQRNLIIPRGMVTHTSRHVPLSWWRLHTFVRTHAHVRPRALVRFIFAWRFSRSRFAAISAEPRSNAQNDGHRFPNNLWINSYFLSLDYRRFQFVIIPYAVLKGILVIIKYLSSWNDVILSEFVSDESECKTNSGEIGLIESFIVWQERINELFCI